MLDSVNLFALTTTLGYERVRRCKPLIKHIGKNTACNLNAVFKQPAFCIYKCQQYMVLNENDEIYKFDTLKEQWWLWVSISIDWSRKSIVFKCKLSIAIDLSKGFPISVFNDGSLLEEFHFGVFFSPEQSYKFCIMQYARRTAATSFYWTYPIT